ncbi:MAG TPA: adenosylmethionine--8-amino-7-oxononanoate transaminase [Terriglobales bacterium]|nr:adenosylmethionine--8-amino-7-oxononanoate transaminase [Terriglobales bacterium]
MAESRVWYPYTQMLGLAPPIEIARAQGAWLEASDGRRYLDAISSWWVTLHGHAHPAIAAAIARQARELEQVILAGFTHRPAEELAERLVGLAPPGLTRVFYSDNGSTAVEVALKMAAQSWQQRGAPQRRRFVALEHAYHGDTLGAMAVSAASAFTAPFADLLFAAERVPTAYCYRCPVGRRRATCAIDCLQPLAQLLAERGDQVAAVIVEPLLQGAGGMIVQPPEFLRGVRQLCDQHGALLIADEVLTGFGRTGTLFACEQAGIAPDILCLSKGLTAGFLPLAATLCTEAVYAAFLQRDRRQTLFHGHSFTGNPLGCAAALASLQLFRDEPVLPRIAAIAAHHAVRLERVRHHPRVGDVRQAGSVAALELADAGAGYLADVGPRLQQFYLQQGVLLRPLGPVVYVLPPYCIQGSELDRIWDVIEASLELL